MALELSPFRTVVRFRASAPKIYRVDYSWTPRIKRDVSESHYLWDPKDPRSSENDATQARIDGWPDNYLAEFFERQPNQRLVEILEVTEVTDTDYYWWLDGGSLREGYYDFYRLGVDFNSTFIERYTDVLFFESEQEGQDWRDYLPEADQNGPIDYYDLRADNGPARV